MWNLIDIGHEKQIIIGYCVSRKNTFHASLLCFCGCPEFNQYTNQEQRCLKVCCKTLWNINRKHNLTRKTLQTCALVQKCFDTEWTQCSKLQCLKLFEATKGKSCKQEIRKRTTVWWWLKEHICPLRRSIGVEKVPAGGRVSSLNPDHLKPMRKRKRKEYLSPSEEDSDIEGTVGQHCLVRSDIHEYGWKNLLKVK